MKIFLTLPLAAAVVAGALSVSRDASALGPVGVEVGAKVGAGTSPADGPVNPLGFGLGGRAGVSVFGVYAGVSYMYYFGETADGIRGKSMLYGFEGGYGIHIAGLVTLRPQLGIGVYDATFESLESQPFAPGSGGPSDEKHLYLEPGLTVLVPLGLWFVGADANVLVLPGLSGSKAAFTFHGQIGLKF